MIHVFGDSHAGKFGVDDRFILCGPPSPTAYGLANEKARSESLLMLRAMLVDVTEDDIILFVLGEIDCRVHIYRQYVITRKPILSIIDNVIERYGRILLAVRKDNGCNIAVLDVPPATAQENVYELDHYATRPERATIIKLFNRQMGDWCEKNEVCFVKLWPYITDSKGWLREEYAVWDGAHVSEETVPFVVDELKKCFPSLS